MTAVIYSFTQMFVYYLPSGNPSGNLPGPSGIAVILGGGYGGLVTGTFWDPFLLVTCPSCVGTKKNPKRTPGPQILCNLPGCFL